jgi:Transposase DDE domain group 1
VGGLTLLKVQVEWFVLSALSPAITIMGQSKRTSKPKPGLGKSRRDVTGGKRGNGHQRSRRIRRPDPRTFRIGKPDPCLTRVAGLVMFGAFLRAIGVDRELSKTFGSLKTGDQVIYPMAAQLRMLLDLFVLGEPRVFGLESLSADPLFVSLCGGVVPSLDTVYRDLNRFDDVAILALETLMADQGLSGVKRLRSPRIAHLDIDTTVEPVFGGQEGALPGPNPHYHGRPSYHPILARIAETDTCVGAWLRPGNTAFGAAEVPDIQRWMDRTRAVIGPHCLLYVRIDGAADCTDVMTAIAAKGAFFLTKGRMTPDLCGAVANTLRWKTVDKDADGKPLRQVATIDFARKEWRDRDLAVRVVAVRSRERENGKNISLWNDLDYTVQVFLTNDTYSTEDDIAHRYDKRAGIEPLIGEWKSSWGIGKVPSTNFQANHVTLLLKLLAHNLLRRYVAEQVPVLRLWRAPWIRRALLNIPGRITFSSRRRSIRMPPRSAYLPMLN